MDSYNLTRPKVMKFTKSKAGRDLLVDNQGQVYMFHHTSTTATGEHSYWRCVDVKGCRAFAHMHNGEIQNSVVHTQHIRTFSQFKEMAKAEEKNLVHKSRDLTMMPRDLMAEFDKLPVEVKNCASCKTKLMARMKKERALAVKKLKID